MRILKDKQEAECTIAIFRPVSADVCMLEPVNVDIVTWLGIFDYDDEPPSLSGMLLADAVLDMNATHLSLEDNRVKARAGYND